MAGLLTGDGPAPGDTARERARPVRLLRLVLGRAAGAVVVLWGAVTLAFVVLRIMPGSTVDVLLARSSVPPRVRAEIIAEHHLDDPLFTQYLDHLARILRGDFGDSYVLRQPVWEAVGSQLPATLTLIGSTLLVTAVGSVVLAVLGAHRHHWVRSLFAAAESVVVALPPFWLGLLLLTFFSFGLGWFPTVGAPGASGLVLPTLALAAAPTAVVAQVLREGLLRALGEPFVVTARARGIGELGLRLRHVLRHALLPATTLLGWIAGSLIGGAVIVEIVFSRQGVGRLVLSAVQNKDMPVVMAVVLLAAAVFVLVNLLVDALQWLVDPRIRDTGRPA
ncbi:ABC transporter permease [Streptomyces sp. NPDC098101]|uniref:ABC transporter permease n=1 Tax=Streptomyces sp. NPDC098101 TaxID=3366096 RepID=UPI003805694F